MRLKGKQLQLTLDASARDFLVEKGYDPTYGARPMRRAVERFLEDPLAEEILKGSLHPNEPITATLEEGKLAFKQKAADNPKALSELRKTLPSSPTKWLMGLLRTGLRCGSLVGAFSGRDPVGHINAVDFVVINGQALPWPHVH